MKTSDKGYLFLSGGQWTCLLIDRPEFAEQCDWRTLLVEDWEKLLSARPQFADKCNCWERFSGTAWARLLSVQPQFADKCDSWVEFGAYDWVVLLGLQPQFAEKCDWSKFNVDSNIYPERFRALAFASRWVSFFSLLSKQPRFADKCDWKICDWKMLKSLKGWSGSAGLGRFKSAWVDLLRAQPQFADKLAGWEEMLSKWDWLHLLSVQPQFADRYDFGELCGSDWPALLRSQPQFAEKCDWGKLDVSDWVNLLGSQPQFADKFHWWMLAPSWINLLAAQPQFADRCDCWVKFNGSDWRRLLVAQPQFADRCDCWVEFNELDWRRLLVAQPQFADRCDCWYEFDESDWVDLLVAQPQLADKCDLWGEFDGKSWARLLGVQPQFADRCNWKMLKSGDWDDLLERQPQFAEKRVWEKFSDAEWKNLLEGLPRSSDNSGKQEEHAESDSCLVIYTRWMAHGIIQHSDMEKIKSRIAHGEQILGWEDCYELSGAPLGCSSGRPIGSDFDFIEACTIIDNDEEVLEIGSGLDRSLSLGCSEGLHFDVSQIEIIKSGIREDPLDDPRMQVNEDGYNCIPVEVASMVAETSTSFHIKGKFNPQKLTLILEDGFLTKILYDGSLVISAKYSGDSCSSDCYCATKYRYRDGDKIVSGADD